MPAEKLPLSSEAFVEEIKIKKYLLNLSHEQGKSKAKFFLNRGFTLNNWHEVEHSLRAQGRNNCVTKTVSTAFGGRYTVECNCPTPDGSNPCIRTVWEIRNSSSSPRLITAHPLNC